MATPTKILLMGFEPFGKNAANPTQKVVELLLREGIDGVTMTTRILPVEYVAAMECVSSEVRKGYDIIIMLGLAAGRAEVCLERVALNLMDAVVPDNSGNMPQNVVITEDGPTAYISSLSLRQMAEQIGRQCIPCRLSNTAGTFVCNAVYYTALHQIHAEELPTRALFVHIPKEDRVEVSVVAEAVRLILKMSYKLAVTTAFTSSLVNVL